MLFLSLWRRCGAIKTSLLDGPANHCAATLSALLVFVGIYPNEGGTGSGDLEPWAPGSHSTLKTEGMGAECRTRVRATVRVSSSEEDGWSFP
jgi:hypothetical protein